MALMKLILKTFTDGIIRTEEYFHKPNSLYQSLDELVAAYSDTESVEGLNDKEAIDKYFRYLSSDFGSEATITDIFDTIFYDYPKFCSDLKKLYNDKKKQEIENPQLNKYYYPILFDKFLPSDKKFCDITQIVIDDRILGIIANFIFQKKQRIQYILEKLNFNTRSDEDSNNNDIESDEESNGSDIESDEESNRSNIESDEDSNRSDIESDDEAYKSDMESDEESNKSDIESDDKAYKSDFVRHEESNYEESNESDIESDEESNGSDVNSNDEAYKSDTESDKESNRSDIESDEESNRSDTESDEDSNKSDIESDKDSNRRDNWAQERLLGELMLLNGNCNIS